MSERNLEAGSLCLDAAFPATFVPVTSEVWRFARHAHEVAHARRNRTMASGAHVVFMRFVGLHASNLDRAVETVPDRGCARAASARLSLGFLGSPLGHAKKAHATNAVMTANALAMTT